MSSFTLQRITAQDAECEPEVDRLFGPAYDARQRALRRAAQEREYTTPRELAREIRHTQQRGKIVARH